MMTSLVIVLLCVCLSAFFSGYEMAFVSASRLKLRELADAGNRTAKKIIKLYEKPQEFLSTILIGNNIVNIVATAMLAWELKTGFGLSSEWLVTVILVPLLIIFGEMVPKDYCRMENQKILLSFFDVYAFFSAILKLPTWVMLKTVGFLLKIFGVIKNRNIFVSEKEFRLIVEESTQKGILEDHEKQLIERILDFERVLVEALMTPLDQVSKVSLTGTVGEVKTIARKSQARLVLVYEEIPSIVVGVVYVFDLLFEEDETNSLKKYLKSPIFLPQNTTAERAFLTLQQKRQSFAVVTDRNAEVRGIVPIERLMMV